MRVPRLLAVVRKEVIQIRRDPRSLGMAFVIPMILLFLYGYALTLDVDRLKTIVYDQDKSATSRAFLEQFSATPYFTRVATAESYRDVESALDSGRAQVALVIPRHFARDLALGRRGAQDRPLPLLHRASRVLPLARGRRPRRARRGPASAPPSRWAPMRGTPNRSADATAPAGRLAGRARRPRGVRRGRRR